MGSITYWHHEQEQVMTTQQTGQPSKTTKHSDEDMKGQDTAGFIAPRRPAIHLPKLRWQHILAIGILRLFDFNPRRDPDFAWVLLTRLVMMLGISTIQTFLFFYMRDAVGAPHPEQQTTNFVIIVSLTSLISAVGAGWLSDHYGHKLMVFGF